MILSENHGVWKLCETSIPYRNQECIYWQSLPTTLFDTLITATPIHLPGNGDKNVIPQWREQTRGTVAVPT